MQKEELSRMIDFNEIKQQAVGKWPGIYASLGINVGDGRHGQCPICNHQKNFRMDDKGNGLWICTCGNGDGWSLVQKVLNCDFKSACEQIGEIVGGIKPSKYSEEKMADPEILRKMFLGSKPIKKDDLAGLYLQERGLSLFPAGLRYTSSCYEQETHQNQCAMLAVVSLPDSSGATIHRTYLDLVSMGKLNVESPRKMMPCVKKATGGAIRLFEPENGVIGIAEGIETAIACTQMFKIPTWSAINANLLEAFIPPIGIKQVHIFGDNDPNYTGQKAAYSLANRLVLRCKIDVIVNIPEIIGNDFLDEIGTE